MDDCSCCGNNNSNPVKEAMTATAPWKRKQPKQKMDPTITGIKLYNTVTCKERNVILGATNT